MDRSMLHTRLSNWWKTSIVRKRTKLSMLYQNNSLKWSWTGHIMKINVQKWTKDIMAWYPRNGIKQKGRPTKTSEDDLPKLSRRLTRDRHEWKKLREACVEIRPDQ
ncbi:hypothetical protein EVAR_46078_1 [Eumeta japonica]|uniref:Uncharacterized protein n=1 Tax=Eumeta variegata TaxID=151549 RepID=A0A4C1ZXF5_EUMVA|nr:hypothetical protein EVAR_46078_1 [Eumeta japonica]